jgi:3-methyl-2-oxobutanoate hydroxymethyltransferase
MIPLSILNPTIFPLAAEALFCYVLREVLACCGKMWMANRKTIADLMKAKQDRRPIVAVSCYDYTTARLVSPCDVDMILVGDSAAQFILGFDSTLPANMDLMVALTAAVHRGAPDVLLVADMPFLSYHTTVGEAVRNAGRFLVEASAQMVKIEATAAHLNTIQAVTDAGIAVMAHIGIRPQRITTIGRFRADATTAELAVDLVGLADRMVQAGAIALLLEGVAAETSQIITERVDVPVISCGSGPGCDGQILVAPDILGLHADKPPKFAKAYADLGSRLTEAIRQYANDVRERRFPDAEHSYHMKEGEAARLRDLLARRSP